MVINNLLNLTHRELEVFSLLVNYELEVIKGLRKPMSPTELRREIMSDTRVNKNNLTKYINLFVEKQLVSRNDRGIISVNNMILPIVEDNQIVVEFRLNWE
jgi:hypothetical protein